MVIRIHLPNPVTHGLNDQGEEDLDSNLYARIL